MSAQPIAPDTILDADMLAEFRKDLEAQRDRATAATAAAVPATAVCQREYNRGLEKAYNHALDYLDEMLADVVTIALVDPSEGQGA